MDLEIRLARLESRARRWQAGCVALLILTAAGLAAPSVTGSGAAAAANGPASQPAPALTARGPYRLVAIPRELNPMLALVDTGTGHTWTANVSGGGWEDRGVPAGAVPAD